MSVNAAKTYLVTMLPRDVRAVISAIAAHRIQTCLVFLGLLTLTVAVNLLATGVATGHWPSLALNADYWRLGFQRLTSVSGRELRAALWETLKIYLDYPAVWFTFERLSLTEKVRTLAMDSTVTFPVINVRYFLAMAPVIFLLTFYVVLSRHVAKSMGSGQKRKALQVAAVGLPGGGSALGSALAPMACCGSTVALQSAVSVMGLAVTAPVAILVSRLSLYGVMVLLLIGILRTARKINSRCC